MKTFKEAIDRIVSSELQDPSKTYDFPMFKSILEPLCPFMPLEGDQFECIFNQLDNKQKGCISREAFIDLLTSISEVTLDFMRNDPEAGGPSPNPNRTSLTFDKKSKTLRPSFLGASPPLEMAKIDYSFIESLNLQKLADLKHLMQLVVGDSTELTIAASSFRKAMEDLRLSVTIEEVETITETLKDKSEKLSIKLMSSVLSEIEKRLLNSVMEEGQEAEVTRSIFIQELHAVKLGQGKVEIEIEDEKDEEFGCSEMETNGEDPLEESLSFPQMEMEMLKPLGQICEGLSSSKTKSQAVAKAVEALLEFINKLSKFLWSVDRIHSRHLNIRRELSAREVVLKSRVASLEADGVRDAHVIETLLMENDGMLKEMQMIFSRKSGLDERENKGGVVQSLEAELESLRNKCRSLEIHSNKQENELSLLRGEVSRLQIANLEMQEQSRNSFFKMERESEFPKGEDDDQLKTFNFLILEEKEKQLGMLRDRVNQIEKELMEAKIEISEKNETIERLNLELEKSPKKTESIALSPFKGQVFLNVPEESPTLARNTSGIFQRISLYSGRPQSQCLSMIKERIASQSKETQEIGGVSGFNSILGKMSKEGETERGTFGMGIEAAKQEELVLSNPGSEMTSVLSLRNSMNRPEGIQEPLNELIYYARDYLDLSSKASVINELRGFSETLCKGEMFSDVMFRFNKMRSKEKRLMLITKKAFYSIHPKKFKVIRAIPLENIQKVSIAETSALLSAIHVRKDKDYLIESFKRADFIIFIMKAMKLRGLPSLKVDYQSGFLIKGSDKRDELSSKMDPTQLHAHMSNIHKNSQYFGLIYRKESAMIFGHHFKEYFGVLSNLGLLLFKHAGDQERGILIPIKGSVIIENPSKTFGKRFVIVIMYNAGKSRKEFFAFDSETAKKEWCEALKKSEKQEDLSHKREIKKALSKSFYS